VRPKVKAPGFDAKATRLARVREFLGLKRNIVVLLAALLIVGMGEQLWNGFTPRYLQELGAGALVIGLYGTLTDLTEAVYPYPGGVLADRLGRKRALVLFTLLAAAGYIVYLLSPTWLFFLVGVPLAAAWSSMTLPAIFALIGDSLPKGGRVIGFGVQSLWKRVPIILAPPLGGWLMERLGLAHGFRLGLVVTIGLALLALAIQRRYYVEPEPGVGRLPVPPLRLWREMPLGLKRLLVSDVLTRFGQALYRVFVVLYAMNVLGAAPVVFGLLSSARMLAAVLPYIPVAKLADRYGQQPFITLTFAFFTLFPLLMVLAPSPAWLLPAFIVAGLREIGEPSRKALILDLGGETHRGQAVGLYYLLRGVAIFPGAFLGGLLWQVRPSLPFWAGFVFIAAGLVFFVGWGPGRKGER